MRNFLRYNLIKYIEHDKWQYKRNIHQDNSRYKYWYPVYIVNRKEKYKNYQVYS